MASSTSSVDGLISGMNTSDVIQQLMALERQPQVRLQTKQQTANKVLAAYQSLNTKFAALQSAAEAASASSAWAATKATSSAPDAATATTSASALTGTFSFHVDRLATANAYVSATTYGSTAAVVTTASSIDIQKGTATPVTINVGDGSLAAIVSAINGANVGVRAAAVQVAPDAYRLQLTSTTTGATDFTIDGAPAATSTSLGALDRSSVGQDAQITVGQAGQTTFTVTSPSNTITDAMPGVTIKLLSAGSDVTMDITRDAASATAKVKAMVDAANAVLNEIKSQTGYNANTKQGGLLLGDATVRSLQQRTVELVGSAVGGRSLKAAGIELTRDGTITYDDAAFAAAFASNPDGTAALFQPRAQFVADSGFTGSASLLLAGKTTVPGAYGVTITRAATQAATTVTATVDSSGHLTAPAVLTLAAGAAAPVDLAVDTADTLDTVVSRINAASADHHLGIVASAVGGAIDIRTAAYGSVVSLTVSSNGTGLVATGATAVGTDVAGNFTAGTTTIAATGTGQVLAAPASDALLAGLSVIVKGASTGSGTLTYVPGVAQRLVTLGYQVSNAASGTLPLAIKARQSEIAGLDQQIDDWDARLQVKEAALKRQFASLETALGKLKDQSNWLAGQLAGLASSTR